MITYFSNVSENTHRFVTRLALPEGAAYRIPLHGERQFGSEPFVLITPTYGAGRGTTMVPRQVTRYLDGNAHLLRGVIASGNTNFGEEYALAGDEISRTYRVPYLYRFELSGMPEDVDNVRNGLERFWQSQI